jgi:hypothetical protein
MTPGLKRRHLMATDLVSGETVYLGRNGDWTRDRDFALLIDDATTADLHLLDAEARAHEVMAPHLTDARIAAAS